MNHHYFKSQANASNTHLNGKKQDIGNKMQLQLL